MEIYDKYTVLSIKNGDEFGAVIRVLRKENK